jgi:signal peptidase II
MAAACGKAGRAQGPRRWRRAAALLPWLAWALIVLIADQFTKVLILGYYQLHDSTTVLSFFNIVRAHNTGAAFSFMATASGWQRWLFTGIGLAAAGFILWQLRQHSGQRLFSFALASILGGAIGNVVDRLMHGYVVDFLQFHWDFLAPCSPAATFRPSTSPTAPSPWRDLPGARRAAAREARALSPISPSLRRPALAPFFMRRGHAPMS